MASTGERSAPALHRRTKPYHERLTAFFDYQTGRLMGAGGQSAQLTARPETPGELLDDLPGDQLQRIYVLGEPGSDGWASWGLAMAAEQPRWTMGAQGHHLDSGQPPTLRFTHRERRQDVEIRSLGEWFPGCASLELARQAWSQTSASLRKIAPDAVMLSSPVWTGKQLAELLIPETRIFPVLPREIRDLLSQGALQHGDQLMPPPDGETHTPGFCVLDGRVMYGGLLRGLGSAGVECLYTEDEFSGSPVPWAELEDYSTASRFRAGRVQIKATVPADWAHLGLFKLPNKDEDLPGRYVYPREPGETFTVWCDPVEAEAAQRYGWEPRVISRVLYGEPEARPLDTFARKIQAEARRLDSCPPGHPYKAASELASKALRSCVVRLVGSFASKKMRITRKAEAGALPRGVREWETAENGDVIWIEEVAREADMWTHPEWAAAIWSKARLRVLDGPTPGDRTRRIGALQMEPSAVLGVHADSLYLTHDPEWPDDGAWGRLRVKGELRESRPWPSTVRALNELAGEALMNGAGESTTDG